MMRQKRISVIWSGHIKQSWQFFTDAEEYLLLQLAKSFRLSWPMPEDLKRMDFALALSEAREFGMDIGDWDAPPDLLLPDIKPFIGGSELCSWSWRAVESVFMRQLTQV